MNTDETKGFAGISRRGKSHFLMTGVGQPKISFGALNLCSSTSICGFTTEYLRLGQAGEIIPPATGSAGEVLLGGMHIAMVATFLGLFLRIVALEGERISFELLSREVAEIEACPSVTTEINKPGHDFHTPPFS